MKILNLITQQKTYNKSIYDEGYVGTAPVDAYEPNGYGLYNMAGKRLGMVPRSIYTFVSSDYRYAKPRIYG